ncbi:DUF2726 domain-containing protein [Aurantivibrio plasticivorans]
MNILKLLWEIIASIFKGSHIEAKENTRRERSFTSSGFERDHQDRQTQTIKRNSYTSQRLLNKGEETLYWSLIKHLKREYYVHSQVSLGELLACGDESGYRAINSKRADFCITNKRFNPLLVIEFHGKGHFQGNAKKRDHNKKLALEKANIIYHEVYDSELISIDQHIKNRILPMLETANKCI